MLFANSKFFAILLAFAIIPAFSFAGISASQAVDFVGSSGFLGTGESAEISPPVQITASNSKYWVVTITSGTLIAGFVSVNASKALPEVLESKTTNEQLFKTAYFLRFLNTKSEALQSQWFFTPQNIDFFESLNRVLKQEQESDISLVSSETKILAIKSKADEMKIALASMQEDCKSIGKGISAALTEETDFSSNPTPEKSSNVVLAFEAVKDDMSSLEQKAIDYDSKVSALRKAIADANLDSTVKQQLMAFAEPPSALNKSAISSRKQAANASILAVQQALKEAISYSIVFSDSLQSRLKRVKAYNELYSEDASFKTTTKDYSILKTAVLDVLSETKVSLWKSQSEVKKLSGYWTNAELAFQKTNYDAAISEAQKAKQSIGLILKAGVKEQAPIDQPMNTDIFVQFAVGIAAVLALIIFIQKVLPKIIKPKGPQEDFEEFKDSYSMKR
ncbi:MAG: hypothetical protein Q7R70_06210 [Candidatus Diapherotrites archaeon]|nr:hypothetical protein [Candidatus Diapherotrites archaeon]